MSFSLVFLAFLSTLFDCTVYSANRALLEYTEHYFDVIEIPLTIISARFRVEATTNAVPAVLVTVHSIQHSWLPGL